MTDLQKLKELALAAQKVSYHSDTGMLFNHEAAKALPALIAELEAARGVVEAARGVVEASRRLRDDLRLRADFAGTDTVECGRGVWDDINATLAHYQEQDK